MSNEQPNRYDRYIEYMRTIDPEAYGVLSFNYAKGTWSAHPVRSVQLALPKQTRRRKLKPPQKRKRKPSYSLNAEVKEFVLNRDKHRCVKCGSKDDLNIHHKIRRKDGGEDTPDNLITLCAICHALEHIDEPVFKIMRKRLVDKGADISNRYSQQCIKGVFSLTS